VGIATVTPNANEANVMYVAEIIPGGNLTPQVKVKNVGSAGSVQAFSVAVAFFDLTNVLIG
jgi:hypothetical protein